MKRLLTGLLALALAASLTACGREAPPEDGRLRVVCTLFPYYDFVRQIGGNRIRYPLQVGIGVMNAVSKAHKRRFRRLRFFSERSQIHDSNSSTLPSFKGTRRLSPTKKYDTFASSRNPDSRCKSAPVNVIARNRSG